MEEPGQRREVWVLKNGEWTRTADPVHSEPGADWEKQIKAAGYENWIQVGELYMAPMTLTVWSRPAPPSYLFDIEGPDRFETAYAETLPDALALLNQLAPTVQALSTADQIARAEPKSMSMLADILDYLHGRQHDKNGHLTGQ